MTTTCKTPQRAESGCQPLRRERKGGRVEGTLTAIAGAPSMAAPSAADHHLWLVWVEARSDAPGRGREAQVWRTRQGVGGLEFGVAP